MAATWTIKKVEAYTEYDDHAQVIFRVHWCCTQSTTIDHTLYSADVTGGQGIEPVPPDRFPLETFTPYADVTEEEVLAERGHGTRRASFACLFEIAQP